MQTPDGLTVLDAPQGFGKTELAGLWLSAMGTIPTRPVVWVPAPTERMDRIDYWNNALAVIQDSCVALGGSAEHEDPERAVREYLVSSSIPFVVVFNRIDLVDGGGLGSRLASLLAEVSGLKVIVTLQDRSISDIFDCVAIDEYLSVDDLRYTLEESVALFSSAGIALSSNIVHSICEKLAGVPALMKLASNVVNALPVRLRSHEKIQQRLDQALYVYMKRRVIRGSKPTELSDFALSLSVARIVTPEIARLVTGNDDAATLVGGLESVGLLFRMADESPARWYFAPAIREALMRIGDEIGGDSPARLVRLSEHCRESSDFAGAVRYALDAQAWSTVAEILARHWAELLVDHGGLARKALWSMPDHIVSSHPAMQIGRDLLERRLRTESTGNGTLPSDASKLQALGGGSDALALLNSGTVQIVILRASGEYLRSAGIARKLSHVAAGLSGEQKKDFGVQLPALQLIWGVSHQLIGNFDEAQEALAIAYRGALEYGPCFVARHAAGNLALNAAMRGDLSETSRWLDEECTHPDVQGWLGPASHIGAAIARVWVALDALDFRDAASAIEILGSISPAGDLWAFAAYARARWALATRDDFGGLVTLQRAVATNEPPVICPGSISTAMLAAARVDLLLAAGEGEKALDEVSAFDSPPPIVAVSAARAQLLTGNPDQALRLCSEIDWSENQFARVRVEAYLIEAMAHHSLGRQPEASASWASARAGVAASGAWSALATVPRDLIVQLEAPDPEGGERVARFLDSEVAEIYPSAIERVTLTSREADVLRELADNLSRADIAQKLFVSPNTLKSHIRSLYRKLGVHSRDEAIAAAHRLSLLS
ncbi:LuxR C-terminal-related transcriptional regulator [Rhodococcus sp. ARC_M6]|uniref:helix-turn-helix transcriptional regulator n=1 Tax=Rhodococcus sp. ARC_M6 TaxID=2928852 RepID=UPI001FB5339E|nr:LuxR C-terminal-related transcriptional regulator [Rhodococcus sp. ARC_M6]MCJ0903060.1 LuxR C-terminal-related transcriptional regulator [Rhodococcus sp. ARC_M6]